MAKYPSLPLWTDSYLADTHPDLTLEQHGCYLMLLMAAWRRPCCSLPNDDEWFCRWLGIHGNKWKVLREAVLERFFTQNELGNYEQKRLRKERDFVEKTSRKQRENAEKRWAKASNAKGLANASEYAQSGNAPTPTPIKKETPTSAVETLPVPEESCGGETRARTRAKTAPASRSLALKDLILDDDLIAIAVAEGRDAERELERFRDHCAANGRTYKDYRAAFRNWLRTSYGKANGHGKSEPEYKDYRYNPATWHLPG